MPTSTSPNQGIFTDNRSRFSGWVCPLKRLRRNCAVVLIAGIASFGGCDVLGDSNKPQPFISIIPAGPYDLMVGETKHLSIDCGNCDSGYGTIVEDPSVAEITQDGSLTGVNPGTTRITAFVVENASIQVSYDVTVRSVEGSTVIEPGTYPAFGLTELESVHFLGGSVLDDNTVQFGTLMGGTLATLSGAEGFVVADLTTREVVFEQIGSNPNVGTHFGTIGVHDGNNAIFVPFGAMGNGFFDTLGQGVVNTNAITFDAFPAGSDPSSGWATVVSPVEGVKYVSPSSGSPYGFAFKSEILNPNLFAGELVSAYMPEGSATSPTLIVSRDVNSSLYFYDRTDVTLAFNLGLDARKIRCADDGNSNRICGVTLFGDDKLARVVFNGNNMPTLAGFANIGDGPVDLDIRLLVNGNYGVLTTGFNDNTVTETEIRPDGSVASNETRAAPSGCINPGHGIYVEDAEDLKVICTCYSSNNYFVEPSRF